MRDPKSSWPDRTVISRTITRRHASSDGFFDTFPLLEGRTWCLRRSIASWRPNVSASCAKTVCADCLDDEIMSDMTTCKAKQKHIGTHSRVVAQSLQRSGTVISLSCRTMVSAPNGQVNAWRMSGEYAKVLFGHNDFYSGVTSLWLWTHIGVLSCN